MKPCLQYKKSIAMLAVNALDASAAESVRGHIRSCDGCRRYWQEMSAVTEKLAAVESEPEIEVTAAFHRRLMSSVAAERKSSWWQGVAVEIRAGLFPWRLAWISAGLAAAALAFVFRTRPTVVSLQPQSVVSVRKANMDLDPTFLNYQTVANRSLEKLDELLTEQGLRSLPPAVPHTRSGDGLTD